MPTKNLEVRTEDRDPGNCIYRLAGDLYGNAAGYAFQEQVRRQVAEGKTGIVVDVSGLERIDSSGIGILAAISISVQKAGAGIVLAALPAPIEKVLGVTWFLKCIDHARTVDEALLKLQEMERPGSPG